ncbi:MAG: hypothetical protein ACKVJK_06585 [Methylophagaceae bacterium]
MNTQITPATGFNTNLKLCDADLDIINGALNINSGQSRYQSEQFVANSQLTPYRMIKQCLLELETRHHSWFTVGNKLARKKIEIKIAQREMDLSEDELGKQLIAIDIEDMAHDVKVWNRKIVQAEEEIIQYLDMVKEIAKDDEALIKKAMGYDHEEERKYWIARMAKQAAMDMVSYGRIGSGNMDSIAMMPEEDQIMALATTLQYNERLGQGLASISEAVNEGLLNNSDALPKFDVPAITDQLMIKDLLNNVQHTTKPKVKSESI